MAGNKTIYDTAMKRAHEYAWANQWDRALKEYGRALAEFPNDRTAQRNMAQCMFTVRHRLAESAGTVSLADGSMDGSDLGDMRMHVAPGTHALIHDAPEPAAVEALVLEATKASNAGDYRQAMEMYDQAVRAGARRPA